MRLSRKMKSRKLMPLSSTSLCVFTNCSSGLTAYAKRICLSGRMASSALSIGQETIVKTEANGAKLFCQYYIHCG